MCEGGADIVKLVVTPKTTEDVLRLLAVTSEFHSENQETPIITVSMGKLGGSQQSERRNFWFLCDICVAWKRKVHRDSFKPGRKQQTLAMLHEGCE